MCGIVAFRGLEPALPALLDGLAKMEYRGYDSVGIALNPGDGRTLAVHRTSGRIPALTALVPPGERSTTGVGHTRWATHGAPTAVNAHPHVDCSGSVAVVHNGTLDNVSELQAELVAAGHVLTTEVDTELIAHLVEQFLPHPPFLAEGVAAPSADDVVRAVEQATARLRGSWALGVTVRGLDAVVLTRHRSPLLVGEAERFAMASSDLPGFAVGTHTVRELDDGDVVVLGAEQAWYHHGHALATPRAGRPAAPVEPLADMGDAEDFTAKEIDDQPAAAARLVENLSGRLGGGLLLRELGVPARTRLRLVACGSSSYAAHVTAAVLGSVARIPAYVVVASEPPPAVEDPDVLTVAFSQSGETADVLTALEHWTDPVLAVTNNPRSTLARRADSVLDLACGPERGVAATKSFTNQVLAGAALAVALGAALGRLSAEDVAGLEAQLRAAPEHMAATHRLAAPAVERLTHDLADEPAFIYVSRGAGVPYALEGALKLKELAYRWVEALPAGEFKHGPLALIQEGTPVIAVQARPHDRLAVNTREMTTRGARLITVGPGEDADLPVNAPAVEPPWGPLESVVALQHFARGLTRLLGYDVDRPRNLAKSVTVE